MERVPLDALVVQIVIDKGADPVQGRDGSVDQLLEPHFEVVIGMPLPVGAARAYHPLPE